FSSRRRHTLFHVPGVQTCALPIFLASRTSLACCTAPGDHPAQYNMQEKFAKLKPGSANPFLDRAGCNDETDVEEAMFRAIIKERSEERLVGKRGKGKT